MFLVSPFFLLIWINKNLWVALVLFLCMYAYKGAGTCVWWRCHFGDYKRALLSCNQTLGGGPASNWCSMHLARSQRSLALVCIVQLSFWKLVKRYLSVLGWCFESNISQILGFGFLGYSLQKFSHALINSLLYHVVRVEEKHLWVTEHMLIINLSSSHKLVLKSLWKEQGCGLSYLGL